MGGIRAAAVAGMFYPAFGGALKAMVERFLEPPPAGAEPPKALIVPHAGYIYSGAVAGLAYSRLTPIAKSIRRAVLIGPSHRVPFAGIATTRAAGFQTPLGVVPVDTQAVQLALQFPGVCVSEAAHAQEHSLEVQLPFLQTVLGTFALVPFVTGATRPEEVGRLVEALWDGAETVVVVSTDLSHYLPYEEAKQVDEATAQAIERLEYDNLGPHDACGADGVRGLLWYAAKRGLRVERIAVMNSGDTAGPRDRVVGYGAFAVLPPSSGS